MGGFIKENFCKTLCTVPGFLNNRCYVIYLSYHSWEAIKCNVVSAGLPLIYCLAWESFLQLPVNQELAPSTLSIMEACLAVLHEFDLASLVADSTFVHLDNTVPRWVPGNLVSVELDHLSLSYLLIDPSAEVSYKNISKNHSPFSTLDNL